MGIFQRLNELEVNQASRAIFRLPELGPDCYLEVAPSSADNKVLMAYLIEHQAKDDLQDALRTSAQVDMLKETVDADREPYAHCVIYGWEKLPDDSGKFVKFSHETAVDLCNSLPEWLFRKLQAFCGEPRNFIRSYVPVAGGKETEAKAKKS